MDKEQGQIFAADCQQNLKAINKVQRHKHNVSPCVFRHGSFLSGSHLSPEAEMGNSFHLT